MFRLQKSNSFMCMGFYKLIRNYYLYFFVSYSNIIVVTHWNIGNQNRKKYIERIHSRHFATNCLEI